LALRIANTLGAVLPLAASAYRMDAKPVAPRATSVPPFGANQPGARPAPAAAAPSPFSGGQFSRAEP
jgi:hypothetical protein